MDCTQCERRKQLCVRRLCIAAERYANQDYVGRREDPFSWIKNYNPDCIRTEQNAFYLLNSSTKIMICKLYFYHRLKISEIADITYKSKQYVSKIIKGKRAEIARNYPKKA